MGVYLRNGSFWIDWYQDGKRRRKKTACKNKREAAKLLAEVRASAGPAAFGIRDADVSSPGLVSRYLEAANGTIAAASVARSRSSLKSFFDWAGPVKVMKIKPELFSRYAAYRKKQGMSVRTVNIDLTSLKTCFNWALRNNIISRNPLAFMRKLKGESQGRLRFLSEDEIRRLLAAAASTVYYRIIFTFLKTGMRKAELANLHWEDVDFQNRLLRVGGWRDEDGEHHTKTYNVRYIPIDDELAAVLRGHPTVEGSPFVFATIRGTKRTNNMIREVQRLAKKAGIEGVTLHVLRHTFASQIAMKTGDIASLKTLLGHSSIQMTMRYAHLAPSHLRSVVEKLKLAPDDSVRSLKSAREASAGRPS